MTAGFFGVAVYHPKREVNVGTLWRSAVTYRAALVATVGTRYHRQASDTVNTSGSTPLLHFTDVADLVTHLPHSCPLVGVELHQRARSLTTFTHPRRALDLLGAEDHGLPPAVVARCHLLVRVPTPEPWSLNVAVAGSLVLHDRYVKSTAEEKS